MCMRNVWLHTFYLNVHVIVGRINDIRFCVISFNVPTKFTKEIKKMIRGALRFCGSQRILSLSGYGSEIRNASSASCKSTDVTVNQPISHQWHIYSAVCVERHPVITAEMTETEAKVQKLLDQISDEISMKSDHELRLEADKAERVKLKAKEKQSDEKGDGQQQVQNAIDLEDVWKAELAAFTFSQRRYDDNNLKSLDRKLDKNLTLLVEQDTVDGRMYLPPQVIRLPSESMREAAERSLQTLCGSNFNARIYGNAPFGFMRYTYPKKFQTNGIHGAKIFYFLAKYIDGDMSKQTEYQWLDRRELSQALPTDVSKNVLKFLLPD